MKTFLISVLMTTFFAGVAHAEIKRIAITAVFVNDFEAAKKWYTEKLGFKLVEDRVFGEGPGDRWISVSAKDDPQFRIVFKLGTPVTHQKYRPEAREAILTVFTDDLEKTASELKARGVTFVMEPEHHPWAFEAMIQDQDGQGIVIAEMK